MKMKSITMIKSREEAREIALSWQTRRNKANMSWQEVAEWGIYFETLARKFNLGMEFKENGII